VDVREAVLNNSLNAKLPAADQREWMRLYGHMVGLPDLVPEKED